MKTGDPLQTFTHDGFDIFHMKLCDECINPADSITSKNFNERMQSPTGVYEKYLRGIELEKREIYLAMVEDERTKAIMESMDFPIEGEQIIFVGDMKGDQRKQMDEYIEANDYGHFRRDYSSERRKKPKEALWIYSCNLYKVVPDIGYYFHRQGMLRYCIRDSYFKDEKYMGMYGTIEEFELLGKNFDYEYIRYAYGIEAWNKLWSYYQKNFIDNFEYGRSCLYIKI